MSNSVFDFTKPSSSSGGGFQFGTPDFGSSSSTPSSQSTSFAPSEDTTINWSGEFIVDEVRDRFQSIHRAYDINRQSCRFRRFFYNRMKKKTSITLTLKALRDRFWNQQYKVIHPQEWSDANSEENNPDDTQYVPYPVQCGSDLAKRVLHQELRSGKFLKLIEKSRLEMDSYRRKQLHLDKRIKRIKNRHVKITAKLLSVYKKMEVTTRAKMPITGMDNLLKKEMKVIRNGLNTDTYRGRINDLRLKVNNFVENSHMMHPKVKLGKRQGSEVRSFLSKQNNGIQKLLTVLQKDLKDLKIMGQILKKTYNEKDTKMF